MKIAIGTLRKPKIDGIIEGVNACPYFREILDTIEYIPTEVSSDISHMPLTIEEVMQGAQNRSQNLIKLGIEADYYVGIRVELLDLEQRHIFLVVCIFKTVRVRDILGSHQWQKFPNL